MGQSVAAIFNQVRLRGLSDSKKTMSAANMGLMRQIYMVQVLKDFFNTWLANLPEEVRNGQREATPEEILAGYNVAVESLEGEDNPFTTTDEVITIETVMDHAERYFDKPWEDIEINGVTDALNNLEVVQGKIRELVGRQYMVKSSITAIDFQMDAIQTIMKAESTEDDA